MECSSEIQVIDRLWIYTDGCKTHFLFGSLPVCQSVYLSVYRSLYICVCLCRSRLMFNDNMPYTKLISVALLLLPCLGLALCRVQIVAEFVSLSFCRSIYLSIAFPCLLGCCSSVRPFLYLSFCQFICSSIICSYIRPFVCSSIRSFARSYVRPFVCSSIRPFVRFSFLPFVCSSICPFVRYYVRPFVCSSVRPVVRLSGCPLVRSSVRPVTCDRSPTEWFSSR